MSVRELSDISTIFGQTPEIEMNNEAREAKMLRREAEKVGHCRCMFDFKCRKLWNEDRSWLFSHVFLGTVVSLNCSISLQRIPTRSPVKRDTLKKNTKFRAGYCFQTKPFHKWVWIKIRYPLVN